MKKTIYLLALFAITFSYASNLEKTNKNFPNSINSVLACEVSSTSTTTTNPDGSTTRTTTTSISCDTPEELANFHALMKLIGMGV